MSGRSGVGIRKLRDTTKKRCPRLRNARGTSLRADYCECRDRFLSTRITRWFLLVLVRLVEVELQVSADVRQRYEQNRVTDNVRVR